MYLLPQAPSAMNVLRDSARWQKQAVCLQATTLAGGGKVFGHDEVHIACCNDGVRPVIFQLEGYVDDEEPVF